MSYFNDDEQKRDEFEQSSHTGIPKTPLQERLEQDERHNKQRSTKKKGGSLAGYFISGLAGVIIGALLLWLLLPSLVTSLPGTSSSTTKNDDTPSIEQVATEVQSDITTAVDTASDAVVGITNLQEVSAVDNFGGFFGGGPQSTKKETTTEEAGSGSGVVYKIDGDLAYIITNYHVVQDATQLEVTLEDGVKAEAELVGSDIWTDLAVITIPSESVNTAIQFGDSDVLKQGQTAIAIGNPLGLDFYGSVTTGVISGTDRIVPVDLNEDGVEDWQTEVIQTDAAINPGNSGGALVNINGELIGINSMKISESTVEGLGFAIPINSVIPIIEELETSGEVTRPSMGISLLDLTEIPSFYQQQSLRLPEEITAGVVVSEVVSGSSADKAGVEQYDVIVEIDGQTIEDSIDLRQILYNEKEIGDSMKIKVYRAGELVELELTLSNSTAL